MRSWRRWLTRLGVFGTILLLAGCGRDDVSALQPKGPAADDARFLIVLTSGVMILVLLVVFVLYTYALIRFRWKGQTEYPKQVEGNMKLEILWTVIPFILLIIIGAPTLVYTFKLDRDHTNDPEALKVKVTAHQFWWEFEYPDYKLKTAQEVVIPVGKKVAFQLESADVIHSFWVPSLGGKKDANPGLTQTLTLQADEPGVYQGQCAELCGLSHANMYFRVKAVSQEEFDRWVADMQRPPQVALSDKAKQGEQIFKQSCLVCHAAYVTDDATGQMKLSGGSAGPSLVNVADRETIAGILLNRAHGEADVDPAKVRENLTVWLKDPQSVKPGNLMPNVQNVEGSKMEYTVAGGPLSDEQLEALVEFLMAQKQQ